MRMTYLDAAREALAEEMRRDPLVWAVGEDLDQVVALGCGAFDRLEADEQAF